jgi:hypothetical protein
VVVRREGLVFLIAVASSAASAAETRREAVVFCESGNCFYRKLQTTWVLPLRKGTPLRLKEGDVVMGVGSGTHIRVLFDDDSRAELKDSGLLRIRVGRKALNLTDGTEGARPTPKATPSGSKLVYVGSLPLRVLTPSLEEPLIFQSFPQTIRVVFEPMGDEDLARVQSHYLRWTWEGQEIVFSETAPGSRQFAATLAVSAAGDRWMRPLEAPSDGLLFKILGGEALETQLQKLLNDSDQNPAAGFELRGP